MSAAQSLHGSAHGGAFEFIFLVDDMVLPWSSMLLDFVVHFQYIIA